MVDNANRLNRIARGSVQVDSPCDQADRRTHAALPNGLQMRYAYDAASPLTRTQFQDSGQLRDQKRLTSRR